MSAVLLLQFISAWPLRAASDCDDSGQGIVVTCDQQISGLPEDFLAQSLNRVTASALEADQISGRLDGRLWDPDTSGRAPLVIAPADDAVSVQTSISRWSAYYSRLDATKIEEIKQDAPADLKLPKPVTARSRKVDVWTSTRIEGLSDEASRRGYTGHIGADYRLDKDFLLGASIQFDDAKEQIASWDGATADGAGYLIGPYLATRLLDNFKFDARLAWGQSQGAIDGESVANGFATERGLAKARLGGNFRWQDWQFKASTAFLYAVEAPAGDAGSAVVTNQFSLEPEVRRTIRLEDGVLVEPFLRYRSTVDIEAAASSSALDDLALSASVGGGISVTSPDEYTIKATTEVEGVGTESDPAISSRVQITLPLN